MAVFSFIKGNIKEHHIREFEKQVNENCGSTCTFKGSVRSDQYSSQKVVSIEFSTHEEIAEQTALDILCEARNKFDLMHAGILHSIGTVNVSETCFYVYIKSGHRKESFEALPWIVNEFKEKVPVFGKEILEDGSYVWKTNKK